MIDEWIANQSIKPAPPQVTEPIVYGYHRVNIPKGTLGETSKIREELLELEDAMAQDNSIMAQCELADLYGALRSFVTHHFPGLYMKDLEIMANATERAFKIGQRK